MTVQIHIEGELRLRGKSGIQQGTDVVFQINLRGLAEGGEHAEGKFGELFLADHTAEFAIPAGNPRKGTQIVHAFPGNPAEDEIIEDILILCALQKTGDSAGYNDC